MITKGMITIDKETNQYEISMNDIALYTCCSLDEDPLEYAKDALLTACRELEPELKWENNDKKAFLVHEKNTAILSAFILRQNRRGSKIPD